MTRTPRRRRPLAALVVALLALAGFTPAAGGGPAAAVVAPDAAPAATAKVPKGLHVDGNHLVDGSGKVVVLRGVNRSGTQYACFDGYDVFDGPATDESIAAMASWHINAVRVPLNEDCWLRLNGVSPQYSGPVYQAAIKDYVKRLHQAGLVAILDLHYAEAGTAPARQFHPMPDAAHAADFWTSVAKAFKADTSTVFDLYNEPYGVTWDCWRDGGTCVGADYQVAGMQSLVNAVRVAGAKNPILLGGLESANDLRQWLAHEPTDPAFPTSSPGLMASWHSYDNNRCRTSACWDAEVAPVAAQVPVVAGEIGEYDCMHIYLDALLPWLDSHGVGYLGWDWNTADCTMEPALISSYDGTPTPYGIGLRDHLAALAAGPTLTTTPSVNTQAVPYYYDEDLALTPSAQVTSLTVTVTVARTAPGVTYAHDYNDAEAGALTTTHKATGSTLVYKTVLSSGFSLAAGGTVTLKSQFDNSDGSAHPTSGDTYKLTATVGGQKITQTGHF